MNDRGHATKAVIHLDRLSHNMQLLQEAAGGVPLWPAIKANAYGHGAELVARHLISLGFDTLCVAHLSEAAALSEAGLKATFVILSAALPEEANSMVAYNVEPAVCTIDMVDSLSAAAQQADKRIAVHVMVDTGMGRIGMRPNDVVPFLDRCRELPALEVRGIMSHFARADETDKTSALEQLARFNDLADVAEAYGVQFRHMANSAAVFDLPAARFDVARPGISIYGLAPSAEIANPKIRALRPVLEWKTRITFLKQVSAGTNLSYGHSFVTGRESLIATLPVGYGDGLHRSLSNRMDVLVHGVRCPQVGRITMDQSLIDVTALGGRAAVGDDAVLILSLIHI